MSDRCPLGYLFRFTSTGKVHDKKEMQEFYGNFPPIFVPCDVHVLVKWRGRRAKKGSIALSVI